MMKQANQTAMLKMLLNKLDNSRTRSSKIFAKNRILQMFKSMQEKESKLWKWVGNASDNLIEFANENKRLKEELNSYKQHKKGG